MKLAPVTKHDKRKTATSKKKKKLYLFVKTNLINFLQKVTFLNKYKVDETF